MPLPKETAFTDNIMLYTHLTLPVSFITEPITKPLSSDKFFKGDLQGKHIVHGQFIENAQSCINIQETDYTNIPEM